MSPYAEGTTVPAERSKAEIEQLLSRYGASRYAHAWESGRAIIGFTVGDLTVRLTLLMPGREDPSMVVTPTGRVRSSRQADEAYAVEVRRRWRALLMVLRAKLHAVDDGISSVEREFMADLVLPDGATVGEWVGPQLGGGSMPALLPADE